MSRKIQLEGRFELRLVRNGKVVHRDKRRNLVTDNGEAYAADRFSYSGTADPMRYLALGSGTNAPLKSDTKLQTEIAGTRTDRTTDTPSGSTVTYEFSYTHSGGSITVNEAGIFDSNVFDTTGMACRFLTQTFSMVAGDVLDLTWTLEFEGVD